METSPFESEPSQEKIEPQLTLESNINDPALGLNIKIWYPIRAANIHTIKDLVSAYKNNKLAKINRIGEGRIQKIETALRQHGFLD